MIDQITWFRTTLKVHTTDPHENVTFSDGTRTLRFMQEDGWHTLNICYTDNGRFLPEGIWTLSSEDGGAGTEMLKSLDVLSRVFAYDKQYAYTVYAEYDLPSEQLRFHTAFMRRDPHPQRRSLKQELFRFGMQCLYTVSAITTRGRDRRVLFLSETRTDMSDNMQHVYDAMLRRGMEKSFHIDFRLRNDLSKAVSPVRYAKLAIRMGRYGTIFVDDYIPLLSYVKLKRGTKLIQLWHAGFGYKLVGYARFGITGSPHPLRSCHRQYTHAIIGNPALKPVYSEVFGVDPSILLPTGMPRLEHFLEPERAAKAKEAFYQAHPDIRGKRVILFAPTYRGFDQKDAHYEYEHIDQTALYDMCRETDSVLIFKWHHFIQDRMDIPQAYGDRFLDLSDESINDLMYVSDVLITDYSSCFYDFLLLQKPILFYVYDVERYSATRGVHYSIEETAPGLIVKTSEELIHILREGSIARTEPRSYMIDMALTNGTYPASDRILDAVFPKKKS